MLWLVRQTVAPLVARPSMSVGRRTNRSSSPYSCPSC